MRYARGIHTELLCARYMRARSLNEEKNKYDISIIYIQIYHIIRYIYTCVYYYYYYI